MTGLVGGTQNKKAFNGGVRAVQVVYEGNKDTWRKNQQIWKFNQRQKVPSDIKIPFCSDIYKSKKWRDMHDNKGNPLFASTDSDTSSVYEK